VAVNRRIEYIADAPEKYMTLLDIFANALFWKKRQGACKLDRLALRQISTSA
jgi:hypothetical protein